MGRVIEREGPQEAGPGDGLTRRSRETADDKAAEYRETPEKTGETLVNVLPEEDVPPHGPPGSGTHPTDDAIVFGTTPGADEGDESE